MPAVINSAVLSGLDGVIEEHDLHVGPVELPVSLAPLLEPHTTAFAPMSRAVCAVLSRWEAGGYNFSDILVNSRLKRPGASAELRETLAHEFGHIHLAHPGEVFPIYIRGARDMFGGYLHSIEEQQCQFTAAYLLVKRAVIMGMSGVESSYIARVIDVPVGLIETRWRIWSRFGR